MHKTDSTKSPDTCRLTPIAEVTRGDCVESVHAGTIVAVDALHTIASGDLRDRDESAGIGCLGRLCSMHASGPQCLLILDHTRAILTRFKSRSTVYLGAGVSLRPKLPHKPLS